MDYDSIIDTTIRKLAMHEQLEGKGNYLPSGKRDPNRRAMLDNHLAKGRLRDSPLLAKGYETVKSTERQIRRTKLSGLPPIELRKYQAAQISTMISSVENSKMQKGKRTNAEARQAPD